MTWEKLPALEGSGNPCACCPPIAPTLPLHTIVAVGFGSATVERDGQVVLDGERRLFTRRPVYVSTAERRAEKDPDHDWRIVLFGPLHGETYQRQGPKSWVLVARNEGFA